MQRMPQKLLVRLLWSLKDRSGKDGKGGSAQKEEDWEMQDAFFIENDLLWKILYKTIHHAFRSWSSPVWRVDICPSAGWLKLSRVFVGWLCVCVCGVCVCVECALISFRLSERAPVLKSLKRDVSRELVSAWDWKSVCVSFSAQKSDWGRQAALRRHFRI